MASHSIRNDVEPEIVVGEKRVLVCGPHLTFDTLDEAKARAAKIKTRAVDTKTMPFANKTGMTDEERAIIDQWVAAGSPTQ